jgi:flagellar hook protein FlgE
MGIYGALSTAVTGLRAQSFALENISGNIANSQTTGFKRIDTDFVDLIPDQPRKLQTAGSVLAQSRSTNTLQGDVKSVSNATYMAVNGSGFFVVEPSIGQSDGNSLFAGTNYYTRRGDFDVDKSGYLVNGSGYYLKGLPVDPATGNVSSSLPEVIRLSNNFLPAQATSRVNYQLNLPLLPKTAAYQEAKTVGSELLQGGDFMSPDTSATRAGAAATTGAASSAFLSDTDTFTVQVGSGTPVTFTIAATGTTAGNTISLADSTTMADVLAHMNSQLTGATVGINGSGNLAVTATGTTNGVTVTDGTSGMGFTDGTSAPTLSAAARVGTVSAANSAEFIAQSISGGNRLHAERRTRQRADPLGEDLQRRDGRRRSLEHVLSQQWQCHRLGAHVDQCRHRLHVQQQRRTDPAHH